MSQYQAIKAATNAYIKTNGRQEITGAILNAVMIATIDSLGKFYQFVGNAVPDTDPGTIDQNIAYLAGTPGTYTHLGGFTLSPGEVAVIKFNGLWAKETLFLIPTNVSDLSNDLGYITNSVADLVNYYTKDDIDASLEDFYTKGQVSVILSDYYEKDEVDSIVSAINRQSYVIAWDGTAEPVIADIPLGVEVTYDGNSYVGTLEPSGDTLNKIYLVSNGAGSDEYITSADGGYSWIAIGTTSVDMSSYATTADLQQLREDVEESLYNQEADIAVMEAKLYGGNAEFLPYALTKLTYQTASRTFKYDGGEMVIRASGVASVNANQAQAGTLDNPKAFLDLDASFWAGDGQLLMDVDYDCEYDANFRIYFYKDNQVSGSYTSVAIAAGDGSMTIDVKAVLKAAMPTSYSHINKVSIYGLFHDASPYGTIEVTTKGFYSPNAGDINLLNGRMDDLEDGSSALSEDIDFLDKKENGGIVSKMPTTLRSLSYTTATRIVKYEGGHLTMGTDGVQSCNIQQANASVLSDRNAFVEVGQDFWADNSRGLILPLVVNSERSIILRILFRQGFNSANQTTDITIANSGDVDIKGAIKTALPGGYKLVTHITIFAFYQSASPYGEESMETDGFVFSFLGEIPKAKRVAEQGFAIGSFLEKPYIYHYNPVGFIRDPDGHSAIAGESLDDIVVASRLGFGFIEANIHKTSDGEYVVLHGTSGKFGSYVKSVNPLYSDADVRSMDIGSVTLDFIKQSIRYNSQFSKYETPIASLEEFCRECRVHNLGIIAGVNGDSVAARRCIDILGSNIIVYSPPSNIRDYFFGYCDGWYNDPSTHTPEYILEKAREVGHPYIALISPAVAQEMDDNGEFDDFINAMHSEGFLVGSSYYTEEQERAFRRAGMDVFVSTNASINDFQADGVVDIDGDADQFDTTGNIVDHEANLGVGESISFGSEEAVPLGKGRLLLRFTGEVSVTFGSLGERTIVSDGSEDIVLTDYFFRRKTRCVITASASTTIVSLVYKTAVC